MPLQSPKARVCSGNGNEKRLAAAMRTDLATLYLKPLSRCFFVTRLIPALLFFFLAPQEGVDICETSDVGCGEVGQPK